MPQRIIFEDSLITLTAEHVVSGDLACPIKEIVETRIRGGTAIEEKIFLSLIAFFAVGIAVVGLILSDLGELALGLGLAGVTTAIIFQKAQLVLTTANAKIVLVRHRDATYVRKLRNLIDDAAEASRSGGDQ